MGIAFCRMREAASGTMVRMAAMPRAETARLIERRAAAAREVGRRGSANMHMRGIEGERGEREHG